MRGLVLIGIGFALATPAAAQPSPTAEVSLRHKLRLVPDDQMTMVNLANLYVRTGRTARAHRLYRGLLGLENVALDRVEGGPVWSHRLAETAIRMYPRRPAPALTAR